MDTAPRTKAAADRPEQARDLQARLYREIGISAVAAALRFTTQPDPDARKAARHGLPSFPHGNDVAA